MNAQKNSGSGILRVAVRTADNALPLPGANVTVSEYSAEGEGGAVLYALQSDAGGLTPPVTLAAPPRQDSMTPGDPLPYAQYNILVSLAGYGEAERIGVPIFDGITAIQPIPLRPLSNLTPDKSQIIETPAGENPLL